MAISRLILWFLCDLCQTRLICHVITRLIIQVHQRLLWQRAKRCGRTAHQWCGSRTGYSRFAGYTRHHTDIYWGYFSAAIVDIRHEVTHNIMPSVATLRLASDQSLQWLRRNYWQPQVLLLESVYDMHLYYFLLLFAAVCTPGAGFDRLPCRCRCTGFATTQPTYRLSRWWWHSWASKST